MRPHRIGLLAAAVTMLLPLPAAADGWGYLYAAAKLTTDYRFHGFSESNRRPTAQGNVHWVAPDQWYLGTVVSGVEFRDGSTSYEVDLYGGRHFYFGANDLNLEVLAYTFPDKAGPSPTYNAVQASAELTHDFGDGLKLAGKLEGKQAHAGQGFEGDVSASYVITPWLTASGVAGYQAGASRTGRFNWDAGLTAAWGEHWLFDARYGGANSSKPHCYYTNWCASGFSATVTYQFGFPL
jgi:uncharacterized protein (TIGR02001 family)